MPVAPAHVATVPAMEPSKQDLAQDQNPYRLPEADSMPAEKSRHEPIPQPHHHKAKYCDEQRGKQ